MKYVRNNLIQNRVIKEFPYTNAQDWYVEDTTGKTESPDLFSKAKD